MSNEDDASFQCYYGGKFIVDNGNKVSMLEEGFSALKANHKHY
ncbi:unnamed protein product [Arabidopsis lyrata]|nr:unnamed protein product [Arabidopsis lyrata]